MQDKTLTPTVSSVTDFTSGPVDLGDMTHYSLHAVFSGSDVAGTFKLQVSNTTTSTDFVDLSGAASSITFFWSFKSWQKTFSLIIIEGVICSKVLSCHA